MGTRAMIVIEGFRPKLFKHWDGYPDGVMPTLTRTVKRFWDERGYEPDMFLAYLTSIFKTDDLGDIRGDHRKEDLQSAIPLLSYRIMLEYSPDIEYIYYIRKNGSIEVREARWGMDSPSLKGTRLIKTVLVNWDMDSAK